MEAERKFQVPIKSLISTPKLPFHLEFEAWNLFPWILPDPISLIDIHIAAFAKRTTEGNYSAIILFIPADGIENKLAACRAGALRRRVASVVQRPTADDVMRNLFNELRRERVERFGILPVREPETLQCDSRSCQIHR